MESLVRWQFDIRRVGHALRCHLAAGCICNRKKCEISATPQKFAILRCTFIIDRIVLEKKVLYLEGTRLADAKMSSHAARMGLILFLAVFTLAVQSVINSDLFKMLPNDTLPLGHRVYFE